MKQFFFIFSIVLLSEKSLQKGLYLHALAGGVDSVLLSFRNKIVVLEQKYLRNPSYTLMILYNEIDPFQALFHFLLKLINGINTQR